MCLPRVQYANEANTTTKNIAALITYIARYTVGPLLGSLPPPTTPSRDCWVANKGKLLKMVY